MHLQKMQNIFTKEIREIDTFLETKKKSFPLLSYSRISGLFWRQKKKKKSGGTFRERTKPTDRKCHSFLEASQFTNGGINESKQHVGKI